MFYHSLFLTPLGVFYLFRGQVESLFLFVRTTFSRLKGFATDQTQENDLPEGQVSTMDRGDQGQSSSSVQPKTNLFGVGFPPSPFSMEKEKKDKEKKPKMVTVILPANQDDSFVSGETKVSKNQLDTSPT